MNPKRTATFFLMVFAVMAPYFGFVVYFSLQFTSGQWPTWFINTLTVWFVANFLIIMLLVKWLVKGQVVDPEKAKIAKTQSKAYITRLLFVCSVLFLYGLVETIQGKIPIDRAIPAGIFLAIFMGIFGWGVYHMRRNKA